MMDISKYRESSFYFYNSMEQQQQPNHDDQNGQQIQNKNDHRNLSIVQCDTVKTNHEIQFCALLRFSWIAPMTISVLLPSLCLGVYLSALNHKQIEPILPFVSDAATFAPQAAYFAQGLDLLAILVSLTSISRYKQLRFYIRTNLSSSSSYISLHNRLSRLNRISLFVSLIGALLMSMTGNFRTSESNDVHCAAAGSMLLCMLIYGCLMCYISYQLSSTRSIESCPITMSFTIVIGCVCFVVCIIASFTSFVQFGVENFYNDHARLNWREDQQGYVWHVICTATEWVTINIFAIVYACLARRMRMFEDWNKVL